MSVKIYGFDGGYMTELDVVPTWQTIWNGIGRATWAMALSDPKCREEYLQFGNYVEIADGDFVWKGLIDTPRGWGGKKVFVTAYELNTVLDSADTPAGLKITGTAGTLFVKLCQYITDFGMEQIIMDKVYNGGVTREETLGQAPLEHIRQVAARSGHSFWIDGRVVNGVYQLFGNWAEKRGEAQNYQLNADNLEFSGQNIITEQGKIVNVWVGMGDASTNGTRLITTPQVDEASIGKYRRRRASKVFYGNTQMSTLMENTLASLKYSKQPRKVTNFSALNVNNLFSTLALGNTLPFDAPYACFNEDGGFGFKSQVEILGIGKTYGIAMAELVCGEVIV